MVEVEFEVLRQTELWKTQEVQWFMKFNLGLSIYKKHEKYHLFFLPNDRSLFYMQHLKCYHCGNPILEENIKKKEKDFHLFPYNNILHWR